MNLYHRPHRLLMDASPGAPPSNGSRAPGSFNNEVNFGTNMVLILAALLGALICALGLNSFLRCAMRCSRRLASETGLKKSALRQIPVAVYGSNVRIPETECPICLGEFVNGEKVRVLPRCHHGFHVKCIDIWLASHSSCPTCRQSMIDQKAAVQCGGRH